MMELLFWCLSDNPADIGADTNVCSVTAIRFLREAFETLKQINYAEPETETSPQQRQEASRKLCLSSLQT